MQQRLSRPQARNMVIALAQRFGIGVPELKWHNNITRARANMLLEYIKLSDCTSTEDTILHEFAHILAFKRCWPYGELVDALLTNPHNESFCEALLETINAWYPSPDKYDWAREYNCVSWWAWVKGITK